MPPPSRARMRRRLPPMRYPLAQELTYRRNLNRMIAKMNSLIRKHIIPKVPTWAAEAADIHALPTGGSVRQDAGGWRSEIDEEILRILEELGPEIRWTISGLEAIFNGTKTFNAKEWKRLIRSQYGVNPLSDHPDRWDPLFRKWGETNARLITNIPEKTMYQVRDATVKALTEGTSVKDTTDQIYDIMSERVDVSESRAKLIARDQVAKLNGDFTRQRQEDIGVEGYIWRTVQDERVRDTHAEADGNFYTWDKPPDVTEGNHPGEDYQCRCWAEPVLPSRMDVEVELLDEAA